MSTTRISVVYVEDEPAIVELLRGGLELFGIDVNPIYGTAEEAYNQIVANQYPVSDCQVLIFDIRLPGMTGMELASRLRQAGETRPVLIVSAYQPPARSELEMLGAYFMPKPFDFPGIVAKIQEMLG